MAGAVPTGFSRNYSAATTTWQLGLSTLLARRVPPRDAR